jgi:cell division protein ZapE
METPKSNPVQRAYGGLCAEGKIAADQAQKALSARLDRLIEDLGQRRLSRKSSHLGWLFSRNDPAPGRLKGLYIYGDVGRGKSMIMDIFFGLAPGSRKRRTHFNEFMADVQDRIQSQRQAFANGASHEADPIRPVALQLAEEAQLLCFDEFSVTDIADAMILGRLFTVLFERGVVVVATSNVAPDMLYADGLNRSLFEPFIDMLRKNCDIFELAAAEDFRLSKTARGHAYLSPLNETNRVKLASMWKSMTRGETEGSHAFHIKGRQFVAHRAAGPFVRFTFAELCVEPHAARDYLAVVARFDTIFIENVPIMDYGMRNEAKRFILLIDTLYDARVRTVISAQVSPHALYHASRGNEVFEFRRTASRLIEMQSDAYQVEFAARRQARQAS